MHLTRCHGLFAPHSRLRAVGRREAPDVSRIDRQIADIERLQREGILSADVAPASIDRARHERAALLTDRCIPSATLTAAAAEAAYRARVAKWRRILKGEDVVVAREALRELLGEVRLVPAKDHLVAHFGASEALRLTGTEDGRWVGSGGASWISNTPEFIDIQLR